MENKDKKQKSKLTTKKLTKIFGVIWFVLVFVFTFLFGYSKTAGGDVAIKKAILDNIGIVAGVIFGTLGVSIFVWLGIFLKLRKDSKTPNDKKIQEIIKITKQQQEEEMKKQEEDKENA